MIEIGDKFILNDLFKRIEKLYPYPKFVDMDIQDKGHIISIDTYYKGDEKHYIEVLKDGVLFEVSMIEVRG
jgi:hypothetical protein